MSITSRPKCQRISKHHLIRINLFSATPQRRVEVLNLVDGSANANALTGHCIDRGASVQVLSLPVRSRDGLFFSRPRIRQNPLCRAYLTVIRKSAPSWAMCKKKSGLDTSRQPRPEQPPVRSLPAADSERHQMIRESLMPFRRRSFSVNIELDKV